MLATSQKEFIEFFNTIEDPREDGRILYPLSEIIFLIIAGVLCCAESWNEIIRFGQSNLTFLRTYLPFKQGIPSKSVLSKVFGLIEKKQMEQFLIEFSVWFKQQINTSEKGFERIIALDGKRLKGSNIHLLHVLETCSGIILGQAEIANKINESVEIPTILEKIDVAGSVITADALNCQKNIAAKIIERDADYFLSLKSNHKHFFSDVKTIFEDREKMIFCEEIDKGHGRVEQRQCWSTDQINDLKIKYPEWRGLNSIICVERMRYVNRKTQTETVYYISSTPANPTKHLHYSREHWAIENKLHWVLDVVFKEDHSALGAKNAAQNMAVVRKLVINMIKAYKEETGDQIAIKTARKASGWNKNIARQILKFLPVN